MGANDKLGNNRQRSILNILYIEFFKFLGKIEAKDMNRELKRKMQRVH